MKNALIAGIAVLLFVQCNKTESKKEEKEEKMNDKVVAFALSNIDSSVSPCENFYKYAIGGWQAENPVPETESRWMSFTILARDNEKKVQTILDEALKAENVEKGSDQQLIRDFYKSALDSVTRNEKSFEALKPMLAEIQAMENIDDLNVMFARLRKQRVSTPVSFHVSRDDKNSEQYIVKCGQSGLTLGDRSYYLEDEAKYKEIRSKYVNHINDIFAMAGIESKDVGQRILKLETQLAEISWKREDLRDADKTYNKMSVDRFGKKLMHLNLATILAETGLSAADSIVVGQVSFYRELDEMLPEVSISDWKDYLTWHVFSGFSSHINDDFEKKHFEFFSTVIRGVKKMKPRDERILQTVNGNLGEPIGKIFVEKYLPEGTKEYVSRLIENLRGAYRTSINNLTWMGDATKEKALAKLEAFTYKVGYPEKWRDYTKLEITPDNYLQNLINMAEYRFNMNIDKLGKPVDKDEWHMTPQMVNAYYNRSGNEIVFPAGILQPPFFHPKFDDAINYGGIGGVIGHEFTHGFDDQGAKYDGKGNKNNWWTSEDSARFSALTTKLAEQYSGYEVLPGEFVNGKLTLGENIADLGGLTLAYMALEKEMEGKTDPMVDGFTWQQRFFLGWANVWKGNITDEALRNRVHTDPHSPAEQRVLGPLANLSEFEQAFGCEGSTMMKPVEDRIKIW